MKLIKIIFFFVILIFCILINILCPNVISWKILLSINQIFTKYLLLISKKIIGDASVFNKKGVIFISNHHNVTDAIIIYSCIKNNTYCVSKSDLLTHLGLSNNFINKVFFNGFNLISYKRGNIKSGQKVKETMLNYLMNDDNILVFPEGTSTRKGIPKNFKNGLFKFAAENYIEIVPITLKYKRQIGIKKGDKFYFNQIFDNHVNIYIHESLRDKNYKILKQKALKLINEPL